MFHINTATGESGPCRAKTDGGCPFGSAAEHYNSADEARTAFEEKMSNETLITHKSLYSPKDDSDNKIKSSGLEEPIIAGDNEVIESQMRDERAKQSINISNMRMNVKSSATGYKTERGMIRDLEENLYNRYIDATPSEEERVDIAILKHSMQKYDTDVSEQLVKDIGKLKLFANKDEKYAFEYAARTLAKQKLKLKECEDDLKR